MTDTKELKSAVYMYERFMYDYMSGWEKNITTLDPREMQWVRPEDLRDVEPLYSAEALERLERERDEARAKMEEALERIASRTQTESLLWWQVEARAALTEEQQP